MSNPNLGVFAGGDISPSRVVVANTGAGNDYSVIQATDATHEPLGVSQEWVKYGPNSPWDTTLAAKAGDQLKVYGRFQYCLAQCGGTVAWGDRVKSDGSGKVVNGATDGQWTVGTVLTPGTANQFALIRVDPLQLGA